MYTPPIYTHPKYNPVNIFCFPYSIFSLRHSVKLHVITGCWINVSTFSSILWSIFTPSGEKMEGKITDRGKECDFITLYWIYIYCVISYDIIL